MDTMSGSDSGISQSMQQGNAAPRSSDLRAMSLSPTDSDDDIATIPAPTVSSHRLLPGPGRPPGHGYPIPCSTDGTFQPPVQPTVNDIFVDGFLGNTFSPQDVHGFLTQLLRTPDFLQYYNVVYSRGTWYITQNLLPRSPGIPAQHPWMPLDLDVRATQGTVVPQQRWIPADEVDVRRHVEEASLELPIFFVKYDGGIGFALYDILQGHDIDLFNRDSQAQLGGRTTTHIRINVGPSTLILTTKVPDLCSPPPSLYSQWPGYPHWKRQIPTRDETYERAPIKLCRLMKHIATSVNNFFNVSSSLLPLSPSLTEFLPL